MSHSAGKHTERDKPLLCGAIRQAQPSVGLTEQASLFVPYLKTDIPRLRNVVILKLYTACLFYHIPENGSVIVKEIRIRRDIP